MTEMTLPEPVYPRIMLMITDCLVPKAEGVKEEPMSWAVSVAHPFIEAAQVVAMFMNGDGIDVYSVRRDDTGGVEGMRDHIPLFRVRVFREAMPFDVFNNELTRAELAEDEDDDGGGDEVASERTSPSADVTSLVPPTTPPDDQTAAQSDGQPDAS
ncbi:hypothetical protein LCGC14_1342810 [marine sediment metagenome]|uniref:Uncharacterized protein n=1 Tax=marine sediment metagenome TaxID=412755 RepID=A0A0F9KD52_9ZZZZ